LAENAINGATPTMRPLVIFQDPSTIQGRQWVLLFNLVLMWPRVIERHR
jgi:hypothetical protein